MLAILALVLPIFGLIALGWLADRSRYLPEPTAAALNAFAYRIAIPALLFRATATMAPPGQSPWWLVAAYVGTVAIVWITATVATRYLLRRPAIDAPAIAMATCFGNGVMLGIPLILAVFGTAATTPIAVLVSCDTVMLWVVGTLHMGLVNRAAGGGTVRALGRAVADLARNPIVVAILLGLGWNTAGLTIPPAGATLIALLAQAAVPVSLTALGMSLARYRITGQLPTLTLIVLLKLVAFPAIAFWLAAYVLALPPLWAGTIAVFAAMPVGANAFVFAARYDRAVGSVSAAVAVSTVLAVATVTAVLAILQESGWTTGG